MPTRRKNPQAAGERAKTFLRDWRQFRRFTLEDAADAIGVSHASLSRVETGKQGYGPAYLEPLSRLYRCARGDLLDRSPSSTTEAR